MKYYVVSDIHGYYTHTITALKKAGYFEDSQPHKLVVLGDLMDRGKEAVEVQEFILDLMAKDEVILIRGNHEDLFHEFVTVDRGYPASHHKSNGTFDTAVQLTGFDHTLAAIRHYDLAEAAMKTPYYKEIMPAMLNYYETEHHVFVHGWVPCTQDRFGYHYRQNWRDASKSAWADARWINGIAAANNGIIEPNKTIMCGHWNASYGHAMIEQKCSQFGVDADHTPFYGKGVTALDACTVISGFVNCVVIED